MRFKPLRLKRIDEFSPFKSYIGSLSDEALDNGYLGLGFLLFISELITYPIKLFVLQFTPSIKDKLKYLPDSHLEEVKEEIIYWTLGEDYILETYQALQTSKLSHQQIISLIHHFCCEIYLIDKSMADNDDHDIFIEGDLLVFTNYRYKQVVEFCNSSGFVLGEDSSRHQSYGLVKTSSAIDPFPNVYFKLYNFES